MKTALEPLVTMAVIVLVAAIALRAAWELLVPIVIPLAVIGLMLIVAGLLVRRWRGEW